MGPVNTMPSLTTSTPRRSAPLLCPGHAACPCCAEPLTLRHILDVLGPDTMAVIPPSCMAIIAGPQPYSSLRIPVYQPTLEASAAAASGLRRALDARGQHDTQVIVLAGDGGTYDIGFQCLSSAAEPRQRGLHEHRGAEVLVDAALRQHRLHAGGQDLAQEEPARDHGRAWHPLRGQRQHRPPR
jgi:Thiamine pyrophosphate enzyme, C-terminal TPP binding domain